MSWYYLLTSVLGVLSICIAPLKFIWNSQIMRIDNLEQEMKTKISKEDFIDRLAPIQDDIKQLDDKMTKILDWLIDNK